MSYREDGLALYKSELYEEALEAFMSEDVDPAEDPELAYFLGLCYTRTEEYNTAVFYLEKSLEQDHSFLRVFQIRMVLAYIYNISGNYPAAESQLRLILDDGFESSQVFTSLGYTLWNKRNVPEAIDFLTRALELDPENPNTLNSLGYIMAEEGINPEKAVEYCRRAVKLKPENGNYMDSLGWALFKTGNLEEARNILQAAMRKTDPSAEIQEHLDILEKYDKK
jgi:tetratricopeptide (TPR) repeat protein